MSGIFYKFCFARAFGAHWKDLDLDFDVPKFNCFFPGDLINDDDHARALFQNALQANPQLACLSGMDAVS